MRGNGVRQVKIVYLGYLAASCTYSVRLRAAITSFVFRNSPELVVHYKVRIYQQCYRVVYGSAAYPELLLFFKML